MEFEFDNNQVAPHVKAEACGACKGVYPFQMSCQTQFRFNMTVKVNGEGKKEALSFCFFRCVDYCFCSGAWLALSRVLLERRCGAQSRHCARSRRRGRKVSNQQNPNFFVVG